MDEEQGNGIGISPRVPARVLCCLSRSTITVILYPDTGLAEGGSKIDIPIEAVPPDLRMPNSEFDMILDRQERAYTRIVRKGDPGAEGTKT